MGSPIRRSLAERNHPSEFIPSASESIRPITGFQPNSLASSAGITDAQASGYQPNSFTSSAGTTDAQASGYLPKGSAQAMGPNAQALENQQRKPKIDPPQSSGIQMAATGAQAPGEQPRSPRQAESVSAKAPTPQYEARNTHPTQPTIQGNISKEQVTTFSMNTSDDSDLSFDKGRAQTPERHSPNFGDRMVQSPMTPESDISRGLRLDEPGLAQQMLYSPEREFVPRQNIGRTTMPTFTTGYDAYPQRHYGDTDMESDTTSMPRSQASMQSCHSKVSQKSSGILGRRAKSPFQKKGTERDRSSSLTKMRREREKLQAAIAEKERQQRQAEEQHIAAIQQISASAEHQVAERVQQLSITLFQKEQAKSQMFQEQVEQYKVALAREESWKLEWQRKTEEVEETNRQITAGRQTELERMENQMMQSQHEFHQQFQALQNQLQETRTSGTSLEEEKTALSVMLQRTQAHHEQMARAQYDKEENLKRMIEDKQREFAYKENLYEKQIESANQIRSELQQEIIKNKAACDSLSLAVAEEKKNSANYEEQSQELERKRNETKMLIEKVQTLQKEMKERKGSDTHASAQDARKIKWQEETIAKYKANESKLCDEYNVLKADIKALQERMQQLEVENSAQRRKISSLESEIEKQGIEADEWLQLGKIYQERLEELEADSVERTGYRWFRKDPPMGCDEDTKRNWNNEDAEEEWIFPETDVQWGDTEYYDAASGNDDDQDDYQEEEEEETPDGYGATPDPPPEAADQANDARQARTEQQTTQASSSSQTAVSRSEGNPMEILAGVIANAIQTGK